MFIFGYYVEKKTIYIVLGIILAIIIGITSVNIRLSKNRPIKNEYVGYVSDDPEAIIDASGEDVGAGQLALYDYHLLMNYFTSVTDAMDFKVYLNDFVANSGTVESEWWVKDISYNPKSQELKFTLVSNSEEKFYVSKTNEKTYISYSHYEK